MMSEHVVFSEEMQEIVESFVVETQEIFDELNDDLLRLESAEDRAPLVDKIFRAVHTVKGTSSFLGLHQLNDLAHHFEDVLNRLRNGDLAFEIGMMDVLFAAFDQMTVLLQQVLDGKIVHLPLDGLLADLKELASRGKDTASASADRSPERPDDSDPRNERRNTAKQGPVRSEVSAPSPSVGRLRRSSPSVRVDVDHLDEIFALAGELARTRNRLHQAMSKLVGQPSLEGNFLELASASDEIGVLASEIRSAILKTRMVPIERVFSKFPRVARDLGRSLNKGIEIILEGSETEIDKSLADEIGEPLLHLIRNAIDHGIEPREVRRSKGKPEDGTITLGAEQQGNIVTISVADDGAGIDAGKIRQKAVAAGLIQHEDAEHLGAREIFELIWRPGFTTTDDVSHLSGRGVGMDVVMTAVRRLNGDVHVESSQNVGTTFSLRLPLSLAAMRGVLIVAREWRYVLPLHPIIEVLPHSEMSRGSEDHLVRYGDEDLPLISLTAGEVTHGMDASSCLVAVLNSRSLRFGLVLDELEGQEDVLVRPVADNTALRGYITGTGALSDGRAAMVLDVDRLGAEAKKMHKHRERRRDAERSRFAATPPT